jgi:hypothetical protein
MKITLKYLHLAVRHHKREWYSRLTLPKEFRKDVLFVEYILFMRTSDLPPAS